MNPEFGDEVMADASLVPEADDLEDTGNDYDMADVEGKEVQITPDGGVTKKIITKGEGWEKPERGDIVTVHYVGTLTDGTQFDSSRDRNEPFTFNLGEGRVIKGWDLGVATMRKGEKSLLTCTAPYAYGDAGSPPKIPGGATLNFEVELLSWKSLKDITGDGGVIKTVVTEGEGWQKPDDRDEVTVVYSAKVQGSEQPFYTTPEEGVSFTVSEGLQGLSAIPVAVKNMKKGEKAHLVVKPEYAYGEQGTKGVPPSSTLEIDLTLTAIFKVESVTDDGLVVKKTLVESSEWKKPNDGAKVTVRLTGKLADGTVFESHPEGQELTFTTDEEMVPEGLDQAVQKMKVGEKALITVAPKYAYGDAAHTGNTGVQVPPGSTVTLEVELVSLENAKESWEMNDPEKVEAASARKEKANKYYRDGKTRRAIKLYDKAVSLISYDTSFPEDLKAKAKDVRKAIQLNLAAAHLKTQNWKEAIAQATKVLDVEPYNVKALYRRAQALLSQGDYVEAEQDVKKGLMEDANNADLSALHRKLKVLMKQQAAKEAALYSKMFKPVKAAPAQSDAPANDAAQPDQQKPAEVAAH